MFPFSLKLNFRSHLLNMILISTLFLACFSHQHLLTKLISPTNFVASVGAGKAPYSEVQLEETREKIALNQGWVLIEDFIDANDIIDYFYQSSSVLICLLILDQFCKVCKKKQDAGSNSQHNHFTLTLIIYTDVMDGIFTWNIYPWCTHAYMLQ